jgi:hypothetical protein
MSVAYLSYSSTICFQFGTARHFQDPEKGTYRSVKPDPQEKFPFPRFWLEYN